MLSTTRHFHASLYFLLTTTKRASRRKPVGLFPTLLLEIRIKFRLVPLALNNNCVYHLQVFAELVLGNLGAHHSREKKFSCYCNFCTWAGFLFSSHLSSLPLVILSFLFSISQHHVSSCCNRNSGHRVLSSHLPEILSRSSHTYLNPQLDIHEISRE